MLIERTLKQTILESLVNSNKIILIFGPRQAGKTAKMPKAWGETYPEASFEVVNREHFVAGSVRGMVLSANNRF